MSYQRLAAIALFIAFAILIGQCASAAFQDLRADRARYEYNHNLSELISAYRDLSAKHYEFFVKAESVIVRGLTAPRDPENVPEIWSTE